VARNPDNPVAIEAVQAEAKRLVDEIVDQAARVRELYGENEYHLANLAAQELLIVTNQFCRQSVTLVRRTTK